jgi:hypothetical protein
MDYWLFQALTENYPLREKLIDGNLETWYATRYRSRMSPGDLVYFALGGLEDIKGTYRWGQLKFSPYRKSEWEAYGVDVLYVRRLEPYLSISQIKADPRLQNLLILRANGNQLPPLA